jgi:nitric oxide reductase large subunit
MADAFASDHHWVRIRMAGWVITGTWIAVQLAFDLLDLAIPRWVRVAGLSVSLVGIVMVAVGFERIVAEAHRRAGEDGKTHRR